MTAPADRARVAATGLRPVDASMTLLNEVMRHPLDPGYQQAADYRSAAGNPPVRGRRRAWLLLLAIILGVVVVAATANLRAPQPAVAQARTLLQKQISERTAIAEQVQGDNQRRSNQIAGLQAAALGRQDPQLVARLAADGVSAGTVPVGGPGLRVTVQDSAAARENPDQAAADERVQDVDLQIAVNGLWASGAEAIAVNGHRLTAITAIRGAGSAIVVDLVPLTGPYVIEAIGDPARLATRFARTAAGQHLATLRNTYGIRSQITSQKRLDLPGSSESRLWSATVAGAVPTPGVGSSVPTPEGDTP